MPRPGNQALPPRVRAAWAYSGMSYADLARKTDINPRTLGGYLRRADPVAPTLEDAKLIARKCGVPESFMEGGWGAAIGRPNGVDRRLGTIESEMSELRDEVARDARPDAGEADGDDLGAGARVIRAAAQPMPARSSKKTAKGKGAGGGTAG